MDLRVCCKCNVEKTIENFCLYNPVRGWRRKVCNECVSKHNKTRRTQRKIGLLPYNEKTEKWCYNCDVIKPISLFSRSAGEADGYGSICKECKKQKSKEHYEKDPQKYIQKGREWREENLDQYRLITREWQKNRRHNDPIFKLRSNISRAVNTILKKTKGSKKNLSILNYLPYTPSELQIHLEKQFQAGWSWENYGILWEIDHIIPQSKLPFDSMEHPNFLKCWELENLRPLSISDNRRKSNK